MQKLTTFLLSFFILLVFPIFAAEDSVVLSDISYLADTITSDTLISLQGENFGTDITKLKVSFNNKDYSVEESYGNELKFRMTEEMKPGFLFIKKSVERNGEISTEESEQLDFIFDYPQLQNITFPQGMYAGGLTILEGENLDNTDLFCSDIQFNITKQTQNRIEFYLPSEFLDCDLELVKNGFKSKELYNLNLTSNLKAYSVSFKDNYILIEGEGFSFYKDDISKLKLIIENVTLSSPDYLSDTSIRFKISTALPLEANANLEVNELKMPFIAYKKDVDIASIVSVSPPRNVGNEIIEFVVETNTSLFDPENANLKLSMNGRLITGEKKGTQFIIQQNTKPQMDGEIWIEKDNFRGEKFKYALTETSTPIIRSMQVLSSLSNAGGKIKVEGDNFLGLTNFKLNSSFSNEIELNNLTSDSFNFNLPYDIEEKDYQFFVSGSYQNSEKVLITVPSDQGKTFYASPEITNINFPNGAFPQSKIIIKGRGFYDITSINYNDTGYTVESFNPNEIIATVPKDIVKEGKISVSVQYRTKSNEKDYLLSELPEKQEINIDLLAQENLLDAEKKDFQQLFSFTILNTKEQLNFSQLQFSFTCAENEDCGKVLPFTDFRLLDFEEKEIKSAQLILDLKNSSLFIKNLKSDVNFNIQEFTIQAKVFSEITSDKNYTIKLLNSIVRSLETDEVVSTSFQEKSFAELNNQVVNLLVKSKNKEENSCYKKVKIDEITQWENCSKNNVTNEKDPELGIESTVSHAEENINSETKDPASSLSVIQVPLRDTRNTIQFKDIQYSDWFFSPVEDLYQRGILNGYADGTFQAGGNLNRAELLKMVLVSRGENEWGTYATVHFEDTEKHWAKDLIEYALEKAYIKPAKTFQPLKQVTRAETIKMMCKMFPDILEEKEQAAHFDDLQDHWAKNCVMAAYDKEIVKGVSKNEFKPNDLVTRAEFAKMLQKILSFY